MIRRLLNLIHDATKPKEAPAEPNHEEIGRAILESLKARGMVPAGTKVEVRRGVAPPEDFTPASIDPQTSWTAWTSIIADMPRLGMDAPGWAKCRFGNRKGRQGDDMDWVYGIARGEFGIWMAHYGVCYHPEDEDGFSPANSPPIIPLASMTHLRTGLGIGLFESAATAIEACSIVETMIDWQNAPVADISPDDARYWSDALNRVHRAWEFSGIDYSPNYHAHATRGGPELGVWAKFENHVKPERLS